MTYEWTELAYLELQAGNTAMVIFGFAVVMVFLVLAAQYESWSLPLAVILVVPMCLLARSPACAVPAVALGSGPPAMAMGAPWPTSTSSPRSASWCWSGWPARTRS